MQRRRRCGRACIISCSVFWTGPATSIDFVGAAVGPVGVIVAKAHARRGDCRAQIPTPSVWGRRRRPTSVDTMLLFSFAALLGLVPSARPRCGALTLCAISSLPIEPLLPEIAQALNESPNLVLQAPPGAGKTTAVPLALLDSMSSSSSGTIIVLEPRRVAARGAATRMAALRGEPVGASIGYSVRGESRKSRDTRVLAVTEGVLVRRLQNDPMLEGVDCIIFDEVCACVCVCVRERA